MPAAVLGAVITGGAGLASAAISGSASKSAAQTQSNAELQAANVQREMYNQTVARAAPFTEVGQIAAQELFNQSQTPFTYGSFNYKPTQEQTEQTPGYQFNLSQGLKATQNSASAKGLGTSGAALKGAATYATGLADSTYQNQFKNALDSYKTNYDASLGQYTANANIKQSIAQLGENAAVNTGAQGTTAGANIGQTFVGGANAIAAGTVGSANATSAGINSLANAYLYGNNQFNQTAGANIYGPSTNVRPDAGGFYTGGGSDGY